MSTARVLTAILLLLVLRPRPVSAGGWPEVHERARLAAFDVLANDRHHGSGFLVDAKGRAITGAHVVAVGKRRLELLLADGTRVPAEVVARDIGHDLALLQAAPREGGYPFLPIAESEPTVGQEIAVFGTPLLRRQLLLFGRVSSARMGFEYLQHRQHYVECRYVSGIGPGGTSGGPWLDAEGRVVGVQIGGISLATGWQGVSFLAPTAAIRKLVATGREQPTPTIRVAVEETWQQPDEFFEHVPPGTDGLVVKVIDAEGPAAKAGLVKGDVIIRAGGEPVRFVADLLERVRAKKDGEMLPVELLGRGGKPNRTVEVPIRVLVEGTSPER